MEYIFQFHSKNIAYWNAFYKILTLVTYKLIKNCSFIRIIYTEIFLSIFSHSYMKTYFTRQFLEDSSYDKWQITIYLVNLWLYFHLWRIFLIYFTLNSVKYVWIQISNISVVRKTVNNLKIFDISDRSFFSK